MLHSCRDEGNTQRQFGSARERVLWEVVVDVDDSSNESKSSSAKSSPVLPLPCRKMMVCVCFCVGSITWVGPKLVGVWSWGPAMAAMLRPCRGVGDMVDVCQAPRLLLIKCGKKWGLLSASHVLWCLWHDWFIGKRFTRTVASSMLASHHGARRASRCTTSAGRPAAQCKEARWSLSLDEFRRLFGLNQANDLSRDLSRTQQAIVR